MIHLSSVIIGPVSTEKAEAMKSRRTYILRVQPSATKISVKQALKRYFDVDVDSVRVLRTVPKRRIIGQGRIMEKRHREKRMIVSLTPKSKVLDLAAFRTA